MDLEDEECHYSKLKTKGKHQIYIPRLEFLELKPRTRRQGKCVGAALELCDFVEKAPEVDVSCLNQQVHQLISNDIWFHLANYIAPEDIQRYSLICSQSANSVNSRTFWLQIYRRYCQHVSGKSKKWVLQLPEHLQIKFIEESDRNTLRQLVIQALYYCYPYFKCRLLTPYKLETLAGRTYVSSWHKQEQCVWLMCYKFKHIFPLIDAKKCKIIDFENYGKEITTETVIDDWECLAEVPNMTKIRKHYSFPYSTTCTSTDLEGITILVIYCDRFIPFPSDIIYNHTTTKFRLADSRELLSADMRSYNLELDFISSTRVQAITVKYTKIQKFKVLPWWHPDFRIFNKCDE